MFRNGIGMRKGKRRRRRRKRRSGSGQLRDSKNRANKQYCQEGDSKISELLENIDSYVSFRRILYQNSIFVKYIMTYLHCFTITFNTNPT